MTSLHNGHINGDSRLSEPAMATAARFSDIPPAIDIPVAGGDTEEAVEVNLEDRLEDPTELCQLLENENAAKNLWITISLAYAKQQQIDHAIDILDKGLSSLSRSAPKERLSLLGCKAWLDLLKSRGAPRVLSEGELASETKTKDHYLREATSAINDALRINPAFPPLFLTRGVLFLLKASLQASGRSGASAGENERKDSLAQALRCFEDALKSSGGRNMMAIMGRARTQYLLGKYTESLQSYQEVLGKMPSLTDPDPRIGIGCCLWQLGYHDRAKLAWERSLALSPTSKVALALLGIYYLREASKYPPTDPQFIALYKTAMNEHIRKAYTIDKNFPISCATFASYFLLSGRYDVMEPLARKAHERTDIPAIASDGWFLLARERHNVGDLPKAAEFYGLADQARGGPEKGFLPAKFGAIQVMIQLQEIDTAKFRLEKLLQSGRKVEATILLGCLYAEEVFAASTSAGKEEKAVETRKAIGYLETVRKTWGPASEFENWKSRADESILLYLARLYEADHPVESMKCLQEVERLQIDKIPEEDRPDIELQEQNPVEYLVQVRENLPPQLLNNMACFLYSVESYAQAQETFQIALNACVKLTEKQEDERRAAEEDENQNVNDLDTKDTDALVTTISYNLARTYESLGLLAEAQKVYEGLLARHSDYTDASARLAYMALRASPQDEGPRKVQTLYQTDYGNTEVRALMGWYHGRSKKKTMNITEDQEHRHHKHTLQGYDKHDKYALTGMGNVFLMIARDMPRNSEQERDKRSKMYQKAVEFFDKALQLDPRNAYAAQGIAIALCDDKRNFSEAVQVFTKIKDTIRDASVYSNLGHVYAELKQYNRSIENYEVALKKDGKGANPLLLACLSRSWLLKGKVEKSIPSLNTSLDYMQRALAAQPDSVHLQFNIAFLQFQIAQLVNSISESERTLEDVQAAAAGLEAAIVTFGEVAKVKAPPYPRSALEQRAAMAKNTMRKQLERAEGKQRDYEEQNKDKLRAAKERRDEDLRKKREVEERRVADALEREEKIKEERKKIIEETERMAERLRAEAAERDRERGIESGDDSGAGKRGRRGGRGGGKRKKRDELEDGFIEDDGDGSDAGLFGDGRGRSESSRLSISGDEAQSRPPRETQKPKRKRRKLERKGGAEREKEKEKSAAVARSNRKYKSEAVVVDSDSDEASAVATPVANGTEDGDEEMRDRDVPSQDEDEDEGPRQPVARQRKQQRLIADDDDDEDEGEDGDADGGVGVNDDEDAEHANVDLAKAALAAGDGDEE